MSSKDLDPAIADSPPRSERLRPLFVRRPTVVVIEDDAAALKSIELLLAANYRVTACASVGQGLAALKGDVHAVILDVRLKGQTRFGLCEQIRRAVPDVPIILYAAHADAPPSSQVMSESKPFGYIARDVDPKRLLDALDLAIRLSETTRRSQRLLERLKRGRPDQA